MKRCSSPPAARLLLALFLLAACGQPDSGAGRAQGGADPLANSQPSPFSLLPGVPAHPAMNRMSASQLPEASVGLAGATASGQVEIRTVEMVSVIPKEMGRVLDFYVALLPTLGWEPVADYAHGALYRRPAPAGGEIGLFVSINADDRLVEALLFEAKGALPPFAASHAGPDARARGSDPQGAAYNQAGELYVAWERDQRIQRFNAAGEPLQAWGGPGAGPGQFGGKLDGPTGVAVGADGSVFVVDPGNGRIQKFSADGSFVAAFGEDQLEPEESYLAPRGIAAGPDGTIYLADDDSILLFAPDGAFLRSWPARIPANRQYSSLDWLAVDGQGFVYATDGLANVVQKYAPDGTFAAEWGGEGVSPGRFKGPAGIAVAGDRLYVVDGRLGRVQVFSRDGALLGLVSGKHGEPAFSGGAGVAVAPGGDLVLADNSASKLLLFPAGAPPALVRQHPPVTAAPLPDPAAVALLPVRPSAEEWKRQATGWLRGETCAPPCWEGITPGVTTAGEALDLLRRHPLVDPDSVHLNRYEGLNFGRVYYQLNWDWFDGSGTDNQAAFAPAVPPTPTPTPSPTPTPGPTPTFEFRDEVIEVEAADDDPALRSQIITAIRPHLTDYQPDVFGRDWRRVELATLGEVIAAFGEPSHVLAVDGEYDRRTLNLVFERHGFALTHSNVAEVALDASFADWEVLFAVDPLHEALDSDPAALAQPWQGMRDFAFYCRTEEGRPCP